MSAAEIIEMIKKLPPKEKAEVMAFVQLESADGRVEEVAPEQKLNYLPQAEAERRAAKIFSENRELFRRLAQ